MEPDVWICKCGLAHSSYLAFEACAESHNGEGVSYSEAIERVPKVKHEFVGARHCTQIGGDHYEVLPIQPWDVTEAWWGRQALVYALLKDVVKYIARHERKNGLEDLKKAQDCLRKVVELKEAESGQAQQL